MVAGVCHEDVPVGVDGHVFGIVEAGIFALTIVGTGLTVSTQCEYDKPVNGPVDEHLAHAVVRGVGNNEISLLRFKPRENMAVFTRMLLRSGYVFFCHSVSWSSATPSGSLKVSDPAWSSRYLQIA